MRLDKNYRYEILCEDKQSYCYIRYFLIAQGINGRHITPCPFPVAGCGEQYVRQEFPRYLKALRSKNFNSNVLIVAIDSDNKTYNERIEQLNESCDKVSVARRDKKDKLLLFIPKKNIETWIKYFDDGQVDEETDYAHFFSGQESKSRPMAEKMSKKFSEPNASFYLDSLQNAYKEYEVLANSLKNG